VALRSHRGRLFVFAALLGIVVSAAAAPAAVDMSTGIRYVVTDGTTDDCATKAVAALNAYLQNAQASPAGSLDFIATGPVGASGPEETTSAGTVHCYPLQKGYEVTFTCVVETPNSAYDASALCLDIAHNFSGKPQQPLPTPTPRPTGCTTTDLIGTWQSDSDSKLTLTMNADGSLTDSEGVSGNWILYHNTATLTYYGNHAMTLSPDGKHLRGGGLSFTRKC
jgi:hypothetical protein